MGTDWKETSRLQAVRLKQNGWKQNNIAEALGVTKGAVSQWLRVATDAGTNGLRAHPRLGPNRRLSQEQLNLLPEMLSHGAEAYRLSRQCLDVCTSGKGH